MPPKAPIKIFQEQQPNTVESTWVSDVRLGNVNAAPFQRRRVCHHVHRDDSWFATSLLSRVLFHRQIIFLSCWCWLMPPSRDFCLQDYCRFCALRFAHSGSKRSTPGFHWRQIGGRYTLQQAWASVITGSSRRSDSRFFNLPVDHLYASSIFVPYIKQLNLDDLVIASLPDVDWNQTRQHICHSCKHPWWSATSIKANVIDEMRVIGDVKGKNVVLLKYEYGRYRRNLIKGCEYDDGTEVLKAFVPLPPCCFVG